MPTLGEGDLPTDASGHPYTAGQGLVVNGSTTYGKLGNDLVSLYLGETKVSPDPPGAPVLLTASVYGGGSIVSFTAPADDGGLAITGYIFLFDGVANVPPNLTLGETNTALFNEPHELEQATVIAVNAVGQSDPSNAVTVT